MRWRQKDPNNDRCGISDCGKYKISQYTQIGDDIFMVFYGGQEIGTAGNRDAAKRIARDHKQRGAGNGNGTVE